MEEEKKDSIYNPEFWVNLGKSLLDYSPAEIAGWLFEKNKKHDRQLKKIFSFWITGDGAAAKENSFAKDYSDQKYIAGEINSIIESILKVSPHWRFDYQAKHNLPIYWSPYNLSVRPNRALDAEGGGRGRASGRGRGRF